MSTNNYEDDNDDLSLFQRHRWLLPLIVVAAGGGLYYFATHFERGPSVAYRAPERIVEISMPPPPAPPPPPPPPPPPKQEEPPKEEMVTQEEVKPDEEKPEAPKDEPPAITTNNVGDGPGSMAGLGAGSGSGGNGNSKGAGRSAGSKFGWYAGKVQTTIADAMRRHGKTKKASLSVQVRIWPDSTGRVTRATLSGSSGDTAVDEALRNEVLVGLQLSEPPPADMPLPIVLRLSAKQPNQVVSR